MKIKSSWGALAMLIGILYSCTGGYSVKGFIQQTTSIQLPKGTQTAQTFDNAEYVAVGKFIIPRDEVRLFIETYSFEEWSKECEFALKFQEFLHPDNQVASELGKQYYFLRECRPGNAWNLLLNKETGELWIEVMYPDMAGDEPPC